MLVLSYMAFLEALFFFYIIVYVFLICYYKNQVEDEGEDIEIGNDGHCCRLCHEDVTAFSDILRLSKCERVRSIFFQLKEI
ncbi:hypothetical protein Bca4012_018916 [Brassica carinata]